MKEDKANAAKIPAYISLGSNLGQTSNNLSTALRKICSLSQVYQGKHSGIYYTEPQEVKDQSWFANQVLKVCCGRQWRALDFLQALLSIEDVMGRTRQVKWGPRLIDIDLLLFGSEVLQTKELTLPHPRMTRRAFVLVPLKEISPELVLPDGRSIDNLLGRIDFKQEGNRIWQD